MLTRPMIAAALCIGALATYALDSVAATSDACVRRPPKVWKSTGGTFGLCIAPRVGSVAIEYLADEYPGTLDAYVTPLPAIDECEGECPSLAPAAMAPTSGAHKRHKKKKVKAWAVCKNSEGKYPRSNPYPMDQVFGTLVCSSGEASYGEDGLWHATCAAEFDPSEAACPAGLEATDAIVQEFEAWVCSNTLTFTGTGYECTSVHCAIKKKPKVDKYGNVEQKQYVCDTPSDEVPPPPPPP